MLNSYFVAIRSIFILPVITNTILTKTNSLTILIIAIGDRYLGFRLSVLRSVFELTINIVL